MHQVDQAGTADHALDVARMLTFGQVNKVTLALVLHAVVYQQKRL